MSDVEQKIKELDELFSRGVGQFVDPGDKFKEKLTKKLRGQYPGDIVVKLGIDPTRPDLHLGHAVILRKLRKLSDLGCKIVIILGDFTASIGDPTGKTKSRPDLNDKNLGTAQSLEGSDDSGQPDQPPPGSAQIAQNLKTYSEQIEKIIPLNTPNFYSVRNSDWFIGVTDMNYKPETKANINITEGGKTKTISLNPNSFLGKALLFEETRMQKKVLGAKGIINVSLRGFLWTLQHITYSRLIERDMFQDRIKQGRELYMHELLYPVFQGIDSFVLSGIFGSCDLEVGGTDQTFNMLLGREVLEINKREPQAVLTLELLPGTDGNEKMSKSLDNFIALSDEPNEMFGKVMSIPDDLISTYFKLCTYTPLNEVEEIEKSWKSGKLNPRDAKARLAKEIVSIYYGEKSAEEAEESFNSVFKEGGIPKDLETFSVSSGAGLGEFLVEKEMVSSKSEWRRLVSEGAVKAMNKGEKISDPDFKVESDEIFKIGKKRFVKTEVS